MSNPRIGLQLYSVRDKMEKDVEATLRAVAEMGYDCVEFAGYFGHTAEELAAWLKKYGLTCPSVHQTPEVYDERPEEAIAFVRTLGAEYSAIPWYPKARYAEDLAGTLAYFAEVGRLLSAGGLSLLYHNHDFELATVDGEPILDRIYGTVPPDVIAPEFDTCWIKYAGYEPCDYLERYAGRYRIVHLKDFTARELGAGPVYALIGKDGKETAAPSQAERSFSFRPLGAGMQDLPAIIRTALAGGAEYLIVEQDQCYEQDSLEAARESREYLRSLGY